ncbi:AAA family ATPase [Pontibacter sp. SGAir0037]|uniref:AAA family ATPase n=1 Tax=Pontibacter sp. SGAir0037 TaxID=2571030 RepID=UPI0010CCB637|nr:AAA family ATPase [Pontibacter sp. SGAir0037]QCR24678.1 hypothetical protein C1N53_21520 [Pontibacter sp. SGAir0037]
MIFLTNKKFLGVRLSFFFSQTNINMGNSEHPHGGADDTEKTYSYILSLRGTLDTDEIVENSVVARNNMNWNIDEDEANSNRFDIFYFPEREYGGNERGLRNVGYAWYKQSQYRILGVKQDELGRERKSNGNALENLFFPNEVKELMLWVKSKEWYKEKNIPWKRGWLLYGPPGTGKTALAKPFAEDLDMPIYFFSLAQMSNNDLISSWQSMQLNIPCIALIEDIDNVFDKRKNICQNPLTFSRTLSGDHDDNDNNSGAMKTPLTFDTLLNCIDGVDKSDGIFTIITTNDITKIDSAIGVPKTLVDGTQVFVSSRPGRIDRAIELTYMKKENKIEMATKILGEFEDKLSEVLEHIKTDIEEPPAQFQEYCSQIALTSSPKMNTFKI